MPSPGPPQIITQQASAPNALQTLTVDVSRLFGLVAVVICYSADPTAAGVLEDVKDDQGLDMFYSPNPVGHQAHCYYWNVDGPGGSNMVALNVAGPAWFTSADFAFTAGKGGRRPQRVTITVQPAGAGISSYVAVVGKRSEG